MKRYMVIEKFAPDWKEHVYAHFEQHGRLLPDGLEYLDSWRVKNANLCYQLMQTDDFSLFEVWKSNWDELGPWGTIEIFELEDKPNSSLNTDGPTAPV
jgi:hypothetical protein